MKRPSLPKISKPQIRNRKATEEATKKAVQEAEQIMLNDLRQQVADAEQISDVGERVYRLAEVKSGINALRTTHRDELFKALKNAESKGNGTYQLGVTGGMLAGMLSSFSVIATTGTATTAAAAATAAGTAAFLGGVATVVAAPAVIAIGGGLAVRHYYRKKKKGKEEETSLFFKEMAAIEDGIADKIKVTIEETPLKQLASSSKWEDLHRDYARISDRFNAIALAQAALKNAPQVTSTPAINKTRSNSTGL